MTRSSATPPVVCPACGRALELVWVHGHGQCDACGTNVEPCCQGGDAEQPLAADQKAWTGPAVIAGIVRAEGPVLREALLNRVAAHTGCPLEEVGRWLDDATSDGAVVEEPHTGVLRATGGGAAPR